jgi:hypothetical protein
MASMKKEEAVSGRCAKIEKHFSAPSVNDASNCETSKFCNFAL